MTVKIRNTSHSLQRTARERSRFVHVSQWFKPVISIDPVTKVETHGGYAPQITRPDGKKVVPCGSTDKRGRNAFKRLCRMAGISRVKAERGQYAAMQP